MDAFRGLRRSWGRACGDRGARSFFREEGANGMQPTAEQIRWVPLSDIQETNRAESSAKAGAIQVEAEADGRYTLVAGQEQLQRLREEGSCYVAAVISPGVPLEERLSAFVDRLAKGRLHYLEEAEQYRSFIRQDGLTTQQLSQRTGRSVQTVRRKIRLLNLGEEVCALLRHYDLSESIGEALLRMPGQQGRLRVLRHVVELGLDTKGTETLVDGELARMPLPMTSGRHMKPLMRDYRLYLNAIREIVEQMQDAGLRADMRVNTGRAAVDVRISIPVFTGRK